MESEHADQLLFRPHSVLNRLLDICDLLFHTPFVIGFPERIVEPADKGAFAQRGDPRHLFQRGGLQVCTQHELPEVVLGLEYIPEKTPQLLLFVQIPHQHEQFVLFYDMVAGDIQFGIFQRHAEIIEKNAQRQQYRQYRHFESPPFFMGGHIDQ